MGSVWAAERYELQESEKMKMRITVTSHCLPVGLLGVVLLLVLATRVSGGNGAELCTPNPPAILSAANGLVLHYTFDTNNGTVVYDQSGYGNNATVNSATWVTNGLSGGAYQFDGINDFLLAADSPSLRVQQMTVAAWVKPASPLTFSGERRIILSKEMSGAAGGYIIEYDRPATTNQLGFSIMSGGQPASGYHGIFAPVSSSTDQWCHVAGSFDGTNRVVYVNGEAMCTIAAPLTIYHNTQGLYVGSQAPGAGGFWIGLIDDVRVYNRALSSDEMRQLVAQDDADLDGIPDWWMIQHFGHPRGEGADNSLATGDPDGDGYINLEEFQNGGNPLKFDIGSAYIWPAVEIGWKGVAGTNYQVQYTTDLSTSNWVNFGGVVAGSGSTNTVFDTTRPSASRFYRVVVAP
jgi:hypothetical protein